MKWPAEEEVRRIGAASPVPITNAPPAPWTARATISVTASGASAQTRAGAAGWRAGAALFVTLQQATNFLLIDESNLVVLVVVRDN
jgi:hypothetical protein